jgi:N-acyl-L-homoserine lactone synthetase
MERPPTPGAEVLSRGDALAQQLLAWLHPLRFEEAGAQEQREAAYRLRYQAVIEEGMEPTPSAADRLERDAFDDGAVQILGWDGAEAIATCRLVLSGAGPCLPLEESFGPVARAGPVAEWGRVVSDRRLRGEGARIVMGLAARGWLSMRSRGVVTAIGVTSPRLVTLFRALGFPLVVLGTAQVHWGVRRVPVICEGPAAVQMLEHLWGTRETPRAIRDGLTPPTARGE